MMESIGLDIIELERIATAYNRHGARFVRRILSDSESKRLDKRADKIAYLAGRFAAKEAVLKALGVVFSNGVFLNDIEITNLPDGRPYVTLAGRLAQKLANRNIHISITHSHQTAAAVAALERI